MLGVFRNDSKAGTFKAQISKFVEQKAMMFDATGVLFCLGEFGADSDEFKGEAWMLDELAQAAFDHNKK